jgi:hypothetical protein
MSIRAEFYDSLCTICEIHGGSMQSGFRTESRNKAVGGSELSQHRFGMAFDIVLDSNTERQRLLFKRDCWRHGYTVVEYGSYLHVQRFPALDMS